MKFSKSQPGPTSFSQAAAHAAPRTEARPWTAFRPATRVGRFVEDLRTGGKDPGLRRSLLTSFGFHAALIAATLLSWPPSKPPPPPHEPPPTQKGGHDSHDQPHVVVHQKFRAPKYMVNPNGAIIFTQPPLSDDGGILKSILDHSLVPYKADPAATSVATQKINPTGVGGTGTGHGHGGNGNDTGINTGLFGKGGARLTRLNLGDPTCDDGNSAHSDVNLLTRLNSELQVHKKPRPETISISELTEFPPGQAPPVVYITGRGQLHVSDADLKILRKYIDSGGMIFGDAGSPEFGQSFRSLLARLFPGDPLLDISDDDPIFSMPHQLPNGAPSVFHHDGNRATGIYKNGRWAVFYHPGSLKDLWRDGGSSADPQIIDNSYDLGINVICYSYTHYYASNPPGHPRP